MVTTSQFGHIRFGFLKSWLQTGTGYRIVKFAIRNGRFPETTVTSGIG